VSHRRLTGLILVLILTLGVQVSWANPAASAAELRAMSCCAGHSGRPMSLPQSRACCRVRQVVSGPAERPVAAPTPSVVATLVTLAPPPAPAATVVVFEPSPKAIGPPAFLAHRHLQI